MVSLHRMELFGMDKHTLQIYIFTSVFNTNIFVYTSAFLVNKHALFLEKTNFSIILIGAAAESHPLQSI